MTRARLFLFAIFAALFATAANAQVCPQGMADPADGCQQAPPDGVFIVPNFFTGSTGGSASGGVYQQGIARENGQIYAARPPFNVAAVDYGDAYSPSQIAAALAANPSLANAAGTFKDPNKIHSDISTCTVNATGGLAGGPSITCQGPGSGTLDLEDYDFGMYNCVQVTTGGYSTVIIKNNRFVGGPNCQSYPTTVGIGNIGDEFPGYVLDSTVYIETNDAGPPNSGVICVDTNPAHQIHGTDAWNAANGLWNIGINTATGYTLTAGNLYDANTCAGGYTMYTTGNSFIGDMPHGGIPEGGPGAGNTIILTQKSTTFNLTLTSGTLAGNSSFQNMRGDAGSVSSCGGTCGGPGNYTITTTGAIYSPRTAYIFGPNSGLGFLLNVGGVGGTASSVTLTQNLIDRGQVGPLNWQDGANNEFAIATSSTATISYNAILRCNCRPINVSFVGSGPFSAHNLYNYVEEYGFNQADAHLEVGQEAATSNPNAVATILQYTGNVYLTTVDAEANNGDSDVWLNLEDGTAQVTQVAQVDHNTFVSNTPNIYMSSNPGTQGSQRAGISGPVYVIDGEVDSLTFDYNWVDPTGTNGVTCLGFTHGGTTSGNGATNPTIGTHNYNLLTGNPQATNKWGLGQACQ